MGQDREILFHSLDLFLKERDGLGDRLLAGRIKERQCLHGALKVPCSNELLLQLAYGRTFLPEGKDGIAWELVGLRPHSLSIGGYDTGIHFVSLDGGQHRTGEVLNLERILQTGSDTCLIEQIGKQRTVVACCLHDTVIFLRRERLDKRMNTLYGVLERPCLAVLP